MSEVLMLGHSHAEWGHWEFFQFKNLNYDSIHVRCMPPAEHYNRRYSQFKVKRRELDHFNNPEHEALYWAVHATKFRRKGPDKPDNCTLVKWRKASQNVSQSYERCSKNTQSRLSHRREDQKRRRQGRIKTLQKHCTAFMSSMTVSATRKSFCQALSKSRLSIRNSMPT